MSRSHICFIVKGPIVGKQRPRFRRMKIKGKDGKPDKEIISTYTPKKTKSYEELVAEAYIEAYGRKMSFGNEPLELEVSFYFKMPKSWSKKKQSEMYLTPCEKKPDLDNCLKSIQDGLQGVAFPEDSRVTDYSHCTKRWTDYEEYAIVRLTKILDRRS